MTTKEKQEIKEVLKTALEDSNFVKRISESKGLKILVHKCENQNIRIIAILKLLEK